jgi:hypothetical protein
MRHHFTRPWLLGSALLLGLAGSAATAQETATAGQTAQSAPKQKALISFDGNFLERFKSNNRVAESHPSQQKALLPPNSILNRQYPPETSPARVTPLPPTSLAAPPPIQRAAAEAHTTTRQAQPIATSVPAGSQFAQMVQAQSPFASPQQPVIIVVPAGWQPDGSVTFAPRTIVSPEVPAEHWPTSQRNPLGDESKKGLFTWPEIAKKMTSDRLREGPAPERPQSKALLARSTEPAPAPTTTSKALFAPKSAATETAQAEQPAKSRALFNLGRKTTETAATPAPPLSRPAEHSMPATHTFQPDTSQASSVENQDPTTAPPTPPILSDHVSSEPAKPPVTEIKPTKSSMNWRTKGSVSSGVAQTSASEETPGSEASMTSTAVNTDTVPETTVHETAPIEQVAVVEEPPSHATVEVSPVPQEIRQPAEAALVQPAVSTERSLLGKYFPHVAPHVDRTTHNVRDPWQRQAQRDAAAASLSKRKTEASSKALVPNLATMIPGLDSKVQPASTTEQAADSTTSVERVPHYVTPSYATSARATHSYYAPPAEHIVEAETQPELPPAPSSRRKTVRQVQPEHEALEDEYTASELIAEEEMEMTGDDPFRARTPQPVRNRAGQLRTAGQTDRGNAAQPPHHAAQRTGKGYRRLTGDDLAAGIARPFAAVSELTKLPQAVTRLADGLDEEQPVVEPRPRVTSRQPVRRYRIFDPLSPPTSPAHDAETADLGDFEVPAASGPAPKPAATRSGSLDRDSQQVRRKRDVPADANPQQARRAGDDLLGQRTYRRRRDARAH